MRRFTLPAGQYYIGDPCYVIGKEWDTVCNLSFDKHGMPIDGIINVSGRDMFIACTAYGDGCYFDQFGNEYGVDSGTIGVVPVEIIDKECDNPLYVVFDYPFVVEYDDGNFDIDGIIINTRDDFDDIYDEDEDEEEYED